MKKQTSLARRAAPVAKLAKPRSRNLLGELREIIDSARGRVAQAVNAGLTRLYWQIGDRIRREVLDSKRADYGNEILGTLSQQLVIEYGRGYDYSNLTRMVHLAKCFPDPQIVGTLSQELTWSHFCKLLPIDDPLRRDFYAEMCRIERWSVRTLREKIAGMLYERTAISKKPEQLIRQELDALHEEDRLTPDLVFRDPYFLDFLGLKDAYSEQDLETAILRELEAFLLELGSDFSFVARQKRIVVDGEDYRLDLLFYHRGLRRLIAIDLKLGRFQAADKGQMELYLRWLARHEQREAEEPPIGLILCAGKSAEQVELLELNKSGIRVAEYLTELPDRRLLERKLHQALKLARAQMESREPH